MTSFVEAAFISLLQACHPKVKIKQIPSPQTSPQALSVPRQMLLFP